jgi:hypothetical protein
MPKRTEAYLAQFAREWGTRGVRAWHEGWWEIGRGVEQHAGGDIAHGEFRGAIEKPAAVDVAVHAGIEDDEQQKRRAGRPARRSDDDRCV